MGPSDALTSCASTMRNPSDSSKAANDFNEKEITQGCEPHRTILGVKTASTAHRQCGLWAIDSANANYWSSLFEFIGSTSADIIVGQETKRFIGDQVTAAEASLRNIKWKGRVNPCTYGPQGGASAGTFVGARAHIGLSDADDFEWQDFHPRVQLQKVGALCKGGFHAGSMYLRDRVGPSHPSNLDVLDYAARRISALTGPWIIGGDFNCDPAALAETGFVDLIGGVIHAPSDATCGKRTYDYFVVSRDLSPAVYSVHAVADGPCRPHCPVRMLVRAAPRAMLVRHLKAPRGFPARLPHGPPTLEDTLEATKAYALFSGPAAGHALVNDHFPKFLDLVESQLVNVAGLDTMQAPRHKGRGKGPSLVWKCAVNSVTGTPRSSHALRAWAMSHRWLSSLLNLINDRNKRGNDSPSQSAASKQVLCAEAGASRLRVAIARHDHQLGRSPEEEEFRKWQEKISPAMLCHQHWVRALGQVAEHERKALIQKAQDAGRNSWASWPHEGPRLA